jgi:dTDP-4-amino-4,6-dideoxygalactose transaminase
MRENKTPEPRFESIKSGNAPALDGLTPQASPPRRVARFRSEIDAAILRVVDLGHYILGPEVESFEAAFAAYLGISHCVGVGSGTDAIALALKALGVKPGDEVITVALTAAGTAQAILQCGATPVFVDVDPLTRCIDINAFAAAITARTTAVVPVHLFGQPADMAPLTRIAEKAGLAVVEDCAQAHGAMIGGRRVGAFGHAGAFSFYPSKNLGGIGDGGAIVCPDAALAARMRSLRVYGWDDGNRISRCAAGNSRLDEIQAAILSVLLPHLDAGNTERRALAEEYRRRFSGLPLGLPVDDPGAVYHQYAVTCADRDALRRHLLDEAGIQTAIHYTPALHQQPAFMTARALRLPETEALAASLVSLPIQPEIAGAAVDRIAEAVRRGVCSCGKS